MESAPNSLDGVPQLLPVDEIASLRERLRRRDRELGAIRRLQAALNARIRLEELEREALHVAIELAEASGGTIYLHDARRHTLIFKHVVGATDEIRRRLQGLEMPDDRGISGEVFHSGVGRITHKADEETSHNAEMDARTEYRTESIITVPVTSLDGHNLGVLQVLNRRTGQFDQEDLEILEVIGGQIGAAIESARLYEEARRSSVINLIGDISHDVKNLLTPVVTGTQTLEIMMDEMFTGLDAALAVAPRDNVDAVNNELSVVRGFYKEAMGMVYDGAQDAQERVREIADAIKGIITKPHYEPTEFRERAEAVARVLRLVAERRGVTIDLSGIQDELTIELDRKGIYNALYNLVNNAIPETPSGGMISVRARPIRFRDQPGVEIQVADTGRGMSEAVRDRMFTDSAISTKPGGTGLGTRIVKNVVDAHHGTIRVDSELGKGTIFYIELPRWQPRELEDEEVPT